MEDCVAIFGKTPKFCCLIPYFGVDLLCCSNTANSVPGSSYRPLDTEGPPGEPSQVDLFRKASKRGPPLEELIGLVALDSGLRASAIAHLSSDWIQPHGESFLLDVPKFQKCTLGVDSSGKGGDTTKGGVPCYDCKKRPTNQDWLPDRLPDGGDCWRPKSEAGYKGRTIPIKENDTQQILLSYFDLNDIVASRGTVCNRVKNIARRAGIEEITVDENGVKQFWPTTHDLRDTYGNRLARKGFDRFEIMATMGHASVEQAQDYIDLSGRETEAAFDEKW